MQGEDKLDGMIELLGKEFRRSTNFQVSVIDDANSIANLLRLLHILCRQENDAIVLVLLDELPHLALGCNIHVSCWSPQCLLAINPVTNTY